MKYKNEIIHFIGGLTPFLGELKQGDHPNGPSWYRIVNPCLVRVVQQTKESAPEVEVLTLEGSENNYRKFVDIRIPEDSIMEIRPLDKGGKLYKMYDAAQKRIKKGVIHRVGNQDIANLFGGN